MEVYDGSTTNTAPSTATIIALITLTVSKEEEVDLFPNTLGILPLAILTSALVVLVLH